MTTSTNSIIQKTILTMEGSFSLPFLLSELRQKNIEDLPTTVEILDHLLDEGLVRYISGEEALYRSILAEV